MRSLLTTTALLLALSVTVLAQGGQSDAGSPEIRNRYGALVGGNLNLHSAAFTGLPGVPSCCPEYTGGFGIGPVVSLIFELPLSDQLMLGLRGGYSSTGAELAATEMTWVEENDQATQAEIEHTIDASLGSFAFQPLVGYRLTDKLQVKLGGEIGFLMQKDYTQEERLGNAPATGAFTTGGRVRNSSTGEIPGASALQSGLLLGTSYELPLNAEGTMIAAPELLLGFGLMPIADGIDWKAHRAQIGVAILFSPKKSIPPPPPPAVAVTPPPPPPMPPTGTVVARGLDSAGVESPTVALVVEEFIAVDRFPLLNYVFFDEGAATVPSRYNRLAADETNRFVPANLHGSDALDVHHHMLNLIGERLRRSPGSTVRLVGTNAGVGVEEGDLELSRRRAESVRDYLRDVWGIAESRLKIEARGVPSQPSNMEYADGQAENRRVEIYVNEPRILDPVVLTDTLRNATPPTIRFHTTTDAPEDVASWRIRVVQEGDVLKELSGTGAPPAIVDWRVEAERETIPQAPGRLLYTLRLDGTNGRNSETSPEAISVEQVTLRTKRTERIADVEIERANLILFEFDKAELGSEHRKVLQEIASLIEPGSVVTVRGFADRTGETEHNRQLALARAEAVAKALRVSNDKLEVQGVTEPLYDNDLPEGRFYSRTVVVEIRTPVVEGDAG